jgi:1,2-phenylacetyl-CoA epoxidase catalytic subunit
LTREGKELTELPEPALKDGSVLFELPVGSLGQGTYILRVRATLGAEQAEDMTAIVVAR